MRLPFVDRVTGAVTHRPLVAAIDRAVRVHEGVVPNYVAVLRRRRPDATPAEIVDQLSTQYLAAVTGAGVAVGGAAAVPTVGTLAAIALGAGEAAAFLEATALYSLSVAHVHGVELEDVERRRTLLLGVLVGEGGGEVLRGLVGDRARGGARATAARGEVGWAMLLPDKVPRQVVEQANRVLYKWVLRRFGSRQGVAALGRLVPFGIGAVVGGAANAALGRGVVSSVRSAFGRPPDQFAHPAVRRRTIRASPPDA